MKLLLVFLMTITATTTAFASELKILSWYRLNNQTTSDSAAEVCFSLSPAPSQPTFAEITVDKNRRSEALYSAWIGPKGSTCHVVSTSRGLVEVEIPGLKLKASLRK